MIDDQAYVEVLNLLMFHESVPEGFLLRHLNGDVAQLARTRTRLEAGGRLRVNGDGYLVHVLPPGVQFHMLDAAREQPPGLDHYPPPSTGVDRDRPEPATGGATSAKQSAKQDAREADRCDYWGRPMPVCKAAVPAGLCVTAWDDGTLRVEDPVRGEPYVTAWADGTLRLVDDRSLKTLAVFRDPELRVASLTWAREGQRLLAGTVDGVIRVYDGAPLLGATEDDAPPVAPIPIKPIGFLRHFDGPVSFLSCVRDGSWLVAAARHGPIRIYDAASLETKCVLTGHEGPVIDLQVSEDGAFLVSLGCTAFGFAHVFELETRRLVSIVGDGSDTLCCVSLGCAGTRIAAGNRHGFVGVIDVPAARMLANLFTECDEVIADLVHSPCGVHLAALDELGAATLWNLTTQKRTATLPFGRAAQSTPIPTIGIGLIKRNGLHYRLRFSDDGQDLFGLTDGVATHRWQTRTGRLLGVRE